MKKQRNKSAGFTLIAVIFIIVIIMMIAITASSFISSQSNISVNNYNSQKAFYISEAGFQYYMGQIKDNLDWTTAPSISPASFSGGTFTVTTSNIQKNQITVNSAGSITLGGKTYTRSIRHLVTRTVWGFSNDYLLYWGAGGGGGSGGTTVLGNNVSIIGDVFTNSNLSLSGGVTINGDAQSTGTISGDTSGITGSVESSASLPQNPPSLDTTYYDNQLAIAATYASANQTWTSRTLSGSTYINGNLTISNNANLAISGSAVVVVTGNITFSRGNTIGNNLTLISGGLLTINNNITFGSGCILYATQGFSIQNNFIFGVAGAGGGGAIITPGTFSSSWNNATIYGLIYTGGTLHLNNNTTFSGTIVAGFVDQVGNNSQLTISAASSNFEIISGLSGSFSNSVTGWGEIY